MRSARESFLLSAVGTIVLILIVSTPSFGVTDQVLRDMDTIWGIVWDEYADPFFNGVDWHRLPDEVRPNIERATDEREAYLELAKMVAELGDPSTFLVDPDPPAANLLEEYAGVGILIGSAEVLNDFVPENPFADDDIAVLEVFEGTPAYEAGVLIGDMIVAVDDWIVEDATLDDISNKVRGEAGTHVDLSLRGPDDRERTVSIVREHVKVAPNAITKRVDDDIVYIRFDALLQDEAEDARRFLASHADAKHLVLDLRSVSAGDLRAMSDIATWFLGDKELGKFESRHDRLNVSSFVSEGASLVYEQDMTVLIDQDTAGLGEIMALLLSEYNRATLVGFPSAGGFSLTRIVRLPSGWDLNLSVARYNSPRGEGVHEKGLEPDKIFPDVTLETLRTEKDPILTRTFDWIRAGGE